MSTNGKINVQNYLASTLTKVVYYRACTVILFLCLSINFLSAQSSEGAFKIFSSQEQTEIIISSLPDWEKQRWKIQRGMQDAMGDLPDTSAKIPVVVEVGDTFETPNYTRFSISFLAFREERVHAFLYLPKRKPISGLQPAMLALHPTGALGKKIVDGQGLPNRGYAKELAERGYIVIAPDYPSFGELSEYDFAIDRYQSGTMAGIFYHMRCIDLLSERKDVDPDKIGVIGHSLGGHNAMFLAAFDHRIKVVVASCGWTQFEYYDIGDEAEKIYGGRLGPWAQDRYMPQLRDRYQVDQNKIPFNFHEVIGLIAPRSFFSNSPINDSNFDVMGVKDGIEKARKIYEFLNSGDRFQVRFPEAEHDFPTKTRVEAYEFIDETFNFLPSKHFVE